MHLHSAGGQGVDLQSLAMGRDLPPNRIAGVSSLSGENWVGPEEGLGEDVGGPAGRAP
jgi:hypothetical protein